MPISDSRGGGGTGAVDTVNGVAPIGGNVTLTPANIGAADVASVTALETVTQGTPAAPLLIDNTDVIALNTTQDEILFLAGDGNDFNISMANLTGVKTIGRKLTIFVKGAFALTLQAGGNFTMNGDRRMVANSAIRFISDGVGYTEAPNEIA